MDGMVIFHGRILDSLSANKFYDTLMQTIEWKNDEVVIFGKRIITKRKVAWYGETAFSYTYSNITKTALPWTKDLREILKLVETTTGETYNSCLLNLYHNGSEGMAWHSDAEKDLKPNGSIASMSFGAERKFAFKHKTEKTTVPMVLPHGSLLEMRDETQKYWLHRLPPTKRVHTPRINLTFRTIVGK